MSEIKITPLSIAKGAKLTNETWADFVARLRHDCVGEGVDRHSTSCALFTVEQRKIDTGIDQDCTTDHLIYCDDATWANPATYLADCDEDEIYNLDKLAQAEDFPSFAAADDYVQWDILENLDNHGVTGWVERWEYVNAHLTRDAADAFIARKKHDYPKGMRVYVESQYYAWEFNTIKEAILNGEICFNKAQAARITELEAQLADAQKDVARGRYMIKHSGWIRHDDYTSLEVILAKDADLSSVAMRENAIDAAIAGERHE